MWQNSPVPPGTMTKRLRRDPMAAEIAVRRRDCTPVARAACLSMLCALSAPSAQSHRREVVGLSAGRRSCRWNGGRPRTSGRQRRQRSGCWPSRNRWPSSRVDRQRQRIRLGQQAYGRRVRCRHHHLDRGQPRPFLATGSVNRFDHEIPRGYGRDGGVAGRGGCPPGRHPLRTQPGRGHADGEQHRPGLARQS